MESDRARGCLLGQLAGDSLGSLVEFQTPDRINIDYPNGVRDLADGGTWDTLAGQPTDDSEMALALAWTIVEKGGYDVCAALQAYRIWLDSGPFDCGTTVSAGLRGRPNPDSQANGAMMRISPLGIFGTNLPLKDVRGWVEQDAALTHPHPVCRQANALYAMAIAYAIRTGVGPDELYGKILGWASEMEVDAALIETVRTAHDAPPDDYVSMQGWVLVAFQNALWQILHAPGLEDAVIDTVMRGGDTDTNAAICGALLGAVHGETAVPARWREVLEACHPEAGRPGVQRPRPEIYWPCDAVDLADRLLSAGRP